ncbi:MAG TPA: hypothetical protein VFC06_02120 [Demequina sp.]|nr:hypothetical protein [Demequina sp.]
MNPMQGAELGYVWLNRVFVKKATFSRIGSTDIRLSRFDVIVISVLTLVFLALSIPIIYGLMKIPGLDSRVNLWPLSLLSLVAAWVAGRRLAKASPFSRFTGENIFDWAVVTADKSDTVLGRIVGHRVATNEVTTWISGQPRPVVAVEWIGSARAPDAPPRTADSEDDDLVDVTLRPYVESTDWVRESRRGAQRANGFAQRSNG